MGESFNPSNEYLLVALFFFCLVATNIFGLTLYSKIARKSVHDAQVSRNTNAFSDVVVATGIVITILHTNGHDCIWPKFNSILPKIAILAATDMSEELRNRMAASTSTLVSFPSLSRMLYFTISKPILHLHNTSSHLCIIQQEQLVKVDTTKLLTKTNQGYPKGVAQTLSHGMFTVKSWLSIWLLVCLWLGFFLT